MASVAAASAGCLCCASLLLLQLQLLPSREPGSGNRASSFNTYALYSLALGAC